MTTNGNQPVYTSRIIKASALLADTKALLLAWDLNKSVAENFDQMGTQNIFGKTSRKRLGDVLRIFRQRYFDDPEIGLTLASLAQHNAPAQWIDPLLYFFSAQNDRTLRDLVVDVLYPRKQAGYLDIPVIVIQNTLKEWVSAGKTKSVWNGKTMLRVTQNALAALRDFGVLEGKANKHIAPVYLPLESFALIAFWLMHKLQSGNLALRSDEWRLFFLDVAGVEHQFIEAHQEGLLSYHAAGSVVRIEFPAASLQEYANGFLERTR